MARIVQISGFAVTSRRTTESGMTSFHHGSMTSGEIEPGSTGVRIFSASPTSAPARQAFLERVATVARWSEAHGFQGILIGSQPAGVDPWLLTETIIERTRALTPLVSVRPASMHPHGLATMIARLATLHARRVCIHWVPDGIATERAEGSGTHDGRYGQLVEYATLVRELMDGRSVTYPGQHFGNRAVKLEPKLSPRFGPEYMISGACPAGAAAARALGALPVIIARPPDTLDATSHHGSAAALKLGIIASADRDAAWRTALGRFPPVGGGPLTRSVARKVSDSRWHLRLCRLAEERASSGNSFWVGPFDGHKRMCPYLVGSHEDVASAIGAYVRRGFNTFLLDEPQTEGEVEHARVAFELATEKVVAA